MVRLADVSASILERRVFGPSKEGGRPRHTMRLDEGVRPTAWTIEERTWRYASPALGARQIVPHAARTRSVRWVTS